jgi:hypothetical protein
MAEKLVSGVRAGLGGARDDVHIVTEARVAGRNR